jgi:hypothetical protein
MRDAFHRAIWSHRAPIRSALVDIDLCEKGFERYQSLCNMQYDRGDLVSWNGRRWWHPTM